MEKEGLIMDNLTKIVRTEISRQYKSVRQFALTVGIPLSTINSALHNGIGGSSFDTVVQICKVLGIKALSDDSAFYLTDDTQELLTQYAQLDSYGRHTVATVLKVEAERCHDAADTFSGQAAAYGGSFTSVNMPTKNAADAADALRVLKARDSLENKE